MAGVPNPFYTDQNFGKGVAAVVQAFAPDPQATLRGVQAQKTAYETREIRDRVQGREELGSTLAGFDPRDPASASTLQRVIIDAYRRGLKPQETAQFVMSLMSNGGADEAAVTRALVGAGHAPNVNQGVTYRDLQGRRSQIENEAARRTGITAGATIRAAQIAADERAARPQFGPGFMYKAGQGIVPNPHDARRFTNTPAGASPFDTSAGTYGPQAPTTPNQRRGLTTVSPGATLYDTDARSPVFTAPDRAREQGFTLGPGQRRYGPDGKLIVEGPPDRARTTGQGPTLGFGADKQILSAIDERFGVVRDTKDRERMGLKPGDRLPLDPAIEQRLKTRAAELFMDPASPAYKNSGKALDLAAQEIIGDQSNLELDKPNWNEGTYLWSPRPKPEYRVLKKGAKPGAASAMQNATKGAAPAAPPAAPAPAAPKFKFSATNPRTGEKIYSDDQKSWYDVSGRKVQ